MSSADASDYFEHRAAGLTSGRLSENGKKLLINRRSFARFDVLNGYIHTGDGVLTYDLLDEIQFALFAHNIDELLLSTMEPTARSLSDAGLERNRLLMSPGLPAGRLANHLWRGETRFHHFQLPPAQIGDYYWRPVRAGAGLYAASIALGLIEVKGLVESVEHLKRQSDALFKFAPDLESPNATTQYFCLEGINDGSVRMLAKVHKGKIEHFWLVDTPSDHLIDALWSLERYAALRADRARLPN